MDFKTMVASDLQEVFLNLDEFGEEHEIDGNIVVCVIDSDGLREKQGGTSKALSEADKMIYARIEDLPFQKGYGDTLMVDGVPYIVNTWDEDMGIATISLMFTFNA